MTVSLRAFVALSFIVLGAAVLTFTASAGVANGGAIPITSPTPHATWIQPAPTEQIGERTPGPPTPPTSPPRITEDDPRWDCRLMGNRRCGTSVPACRVRGYSQVTERACVALWMRPQRTVRGDGYESTVPAGRELVLECQQDNRTDARALACFLAWLSGS